MNTSRQSIRLLIYTGIAVVIAVIVYTIWIGGSSGGICAGLGLLLVAGALIYLKRMENVSTKSVAQRIKAEFPPEIQPQVFDVYEHLKVKELDGLFAKILDDAHGDVNQVKKLAGVAESVGWQAFLENKW